MYVYFPVPQPEAQKNHSAQNEKIGPLTLEQKLIHDTRCLDPIHQRLWQRRSGLRVVVGFHVVFAVGRFVFGIMYPGLYVDVYCVYTYSIYIYTDLRLIASC